MKIGGTTHDSEIAALLKMRDEDINTSDIPETTDWSQAVVGRFYRPRKEPVTVRLDSDIVAWLKSGGPGYQTRINTLLRAVMTQRLSLDPDVVTASFQFTSLERHGELEKYSHAAQVIKRQGSVFAPAA